MWVNPRSPRPSSSSPRRPHNNNNNITSIAIGRNWGTSSSTTATLSTPFTITVLTTMMVRWMAPVMLLMSLAALCWTSLWMETPWIAHYVDRIMFTSHTQAADLLLTADSRPVRQPDEPDSWYDPNDDVDDDEEEDDDENFISVKTTSSSQSQTAPALLPPKASLTSFNPAAADIINTTTEWLRNFVYNSSSIQDNHQPGSSNNNFGGITARAFVRYPYRLPCFPSEPDWSSEEVQNSPAQQGFMYVKPYKTGSSTCSGIQLRIARNIARRKQRHQQRTGSLDAQSPWAGKPSDLLCQSRFDHGPFHHSAATRFSNRVKEASFLWTVLREPSSRLLSHFFFFMVSRQKNEPSDASLQQFVLTYDQMAVHDYYLQALYPREAYQRGRHDPVATAQAILDDYDFIGITERLDESAVALQLLLNLSTADILYVSAKTKGGFDDGGGHEGKKICTYIWPTFTTPGMQEFMNSAAWRTRVHYDTLLYQAANRSLDLTIQRLGPERFAAALARFQKAQARVQEECVPRVKLPCTAGGQFLYPNETDCLWNDSSCGNDCLDQLATELQLWQSPNHEDD